MTEVPEISTQREFIVDFGNASERRLLHGALFSSLVGKYRISITKYRKRRSDRQNRFYWPCMVQPFAEWLRENYGETITDDDAHEILKAKFNRITIPNKTTGDFIEVTRSTTVLTTKEFNDYLDHCANFLKTFCDINVPEPGIYRES